ncbi:hypothetical protein Mapa_013983 [Marchantia paleacea]|nr:hypothetical protein Mapa_013983 [Marchantia paleacea]
MSFICTVHGVSFAVRDITPSGARPYTSGTMPCRCCNQGSAMPSQRQAAIVFLNSVPVTWEQSEQHAGLLESIGAEVPELEPCVGHAPPPLHQVFMTLNPVETFASNNVADLPSHVHLCQQLLGALGRPTARFQRVEHGGVVM